MNTNYNIPEYNITEFNELVKNVLSIQFSYIKIKGEISDLMGIQVSHTKIQRIIQKYHSFQSQM